MLPVGIFLLEIIVLFFVSQKLVQLLGLFLFRASKSRLLTIQALAFLFLPGTIIHELSHLISAGILFVRTGQIEFLPTLNDEKIKLGSVEIAKTDPLRRAIIGFAPFVSGILLITLSAYLFLNSGLKINYLIKLIIFLYLNFVIGNTMFSSSQDAEGTLELFLTAILLATGLYFTGIKIPFTFQQNFTAFLKNINFALLVPIGVDLFILILVELLNKMFYKTT